MSIERLQELRSNAAEATHDLRFYLNEVGYNTLWLLKRINESDTSLSVLESKYVETEIRMKELQSKMDDLNIFLSVFKTELADIKRESNLFKREGVPFGVSDKTIHVDKSKLIKSKNGKVFSRDAHSRSKP